MAGGDVSSGVAVELGGTTLGGMVRFCLVIFSTIGSLGEMGWLVARFRIWASWIYAFVVCELYWRDGILFCGSCKIARISAAACLM